MRKRRPIARGKVKVRKRLPTRLVAERIHESKKTYRRARARRQDFQDSDF